MLVPIEQAEGACVLVVGEYLHAEGTGSVSQEIAKGQGGLSSEGLVPLGCVNAPEADAGNFASAACAGGNNIDRVPIDDVDHPYRFRRAPVAPGSHVARYTAIGAKLPVTRWWPPFSS